MSFPEEAVMRLAARVQSDLLPALQIESPTPAEPVVVHRVPAPWRLLGVGNYAVVVTHPDHPENAVKVYAPGRAGLEEEVEVYRRLGDHPAYSACRYAGDGFLVLDRLRGITLYDCVHRGVPIPDQVIRDIDAALAYARARGLTPHDVHGRNVMVHDGRGLVADVSDFLMGGDDRDWEDLKRVYYRFYRPVLRPLRLPIPYAVLDLVRRVYRRYRRLVPARS